MSIVMQYANFAFSLLETGLWRAGCEKTTCPVRREGRHDRPYPYSLGRLYCM